MACILDLPVELVLDIIQDFGRDDLCAMRQTCKQLDEYSVDKFGKVCFTTIHLVPTLEPLERLQKLANHQKLKGFVREVKIITGYLTCIAHDTDADSRTKPTKKVTNGALPYPQTHSGWQHYANESAKFVSSGNIGALLAPAFADFDAIKVSLELLREFSCKGIWGALSFQGEAIDWWWTCPNWDYEGPDIHAILCSEALGACYKTNTESLCFTVMQPKMMKAMQKPASYVSTALSNLRTLHIELPWWFDPTHYCDASQSLLVNFLNSVANLDDLKLDFQSFYPTPEVVKLVRRGFLEVRFISLKRLALHEFSARAADLSLFLSRCKATLVSIQFISADLDSMIHGPGGMTEYEPNIRSWIGVLEAIQDSPLLETIEIMGSYPVCAWEILHEIKKHGKYSLIVYINILKDSRTWPPEITDATDTQAEDDSGYEKSISRLVQQGLEKYGHITSKAQVKFFVRTYLLPAPPILQLGRTWRVEDVED